jgi:3-oxoacyl-[acyl-carrier protein] reductase
MPAGSRIIFVSTSLCNTSQVMADKLMYCTTKGAVEQMTRVMAKGLGKKQITVNCVAPGPTATDLYYKGKSEQLLQVIARFSPFERVGTVEEVADAFLFLCGKRASWVTGQTLRVNGGSA